MITFVTGFVTKYAVGLVASAITPIIAVGAKALVGIVL